ncbi:hypothetical protein LZ32DRAFT_623736 [Colletotrichum eremochloae]|nr:hypothetical protein LZ32DRAFT_623736 [Colletotrichum eremochloae]
MEDIRSTSKALQKHMFDGNSSLYSAGCSSVSSVFCSRGNQGLMSRSSWFFKCLCDKQLLNVSHTGGYASVPLHTAYSCHCGWCMAYMSEIWRPTAAGTSNGYFRMTADPQADSLDERLGGALGGALGGSLSGALSGAPLAFGTSVDPLYHWTYGSGLQPVPQEICLRANGEGWGAADEISEPITVSPSFFPTQMAPLKYQGDPSGPASVFSHID